MFSDLTPEQQEQVRLAISAVRATTMNQLAKNDAGPVDSLGDQLARIASAIEQDSAPGCKVKINGLSEDTAYVHVTVAFPHTPGAVWFTLRGTQ